MKVRVLAGALLAAPALLVAMATNGHAGVEKGTVAFAGHITVVPGSEDSANVCFDAVACGNSVNGVATGAVLAKAIIGMSGTIDYTEGCTGAVPYAPLGSAGLSLNLHGAPGDTAHPVNAKWIRAGLVAVIVSPDDASSTVAGAAVVAPAPHVPDVPLCGNRVDYVLTGAMAFA